MTKENYWPEQVVEGDRFDLELFAVGLPASASVNTAAQLVALRKYLLAPTGNASYRSHLQAMFRQDIEK